MAVMMYKDADGNWQVLPSVGPAGKSAYELAVSQGYTGTLHEWLAEMLRATDIANNLTTADAGKVLSALQGKLLNDALEGKQEAITSDNAATVRTALGLKNGALLRVEGGYVMIRVEANSTATADIVFDPPFADTPNAQVTMTTSADPAPFSACISALSANGITIKIESTLTAVRNIATRWLAIG